jgi:cysteine desulfurase family protein (TIGR01976 family)
MPGFDVSQFRAQFPSLTSGLAHFDGPGGTQTPYAVGAAVAATLTGPLSNRGTTGVSETNAEAAVAGFRAAYADFLGVPERGVVYGRSATALTFDVGRAVAASWRPGDEIVVSRLDHDANVRPWLIFAERAGVTVRWLDFDPATSEIIWESVESAITERTRLVAVTGASNLIGTIPPVAAIAARAHAVGALVWVDGVHFAAHHLVDVGAIGADFFVCSPYKFLGTHCAVLGAAPELLETLRPDKLLPSSNDVPERFELGTLPYEVMAGATAAVDLLAGLGRPGSRERRATGALGRVVGGAARPREPAAVDHRGRSGRAGRPGCRPLPGCPADADPLAHLPRPTLVGRLPVPVRARHTGSCGVLLCLRAVHAVGVVRHPMACGWG